MSLAFYNGRYINESEINIPLTNRNFLYGDGLFETVRSINGKPLFIIHHVARLKGCMQTLKLLGEEMFTEIFLTEAITKLNKLNDIVQGGRARIVIFRNEGGTYLPEKNSSSCIIRTDALEKNNYELNEDGISLCMYDEIKKPINKFSAFKTCNSLLYVLASVYAQQNKYNDALLLNENGNICEATSSNIFWVSNAVIYTPPSSDGCVNGVLRAVLLNQFSSSFKIIEKVCTDTDLLNAEEIFLTNTIGGFRWVKTFLNKQYGNVVTKRIVKLFSENMC